MEEATHQRVVDRVATSGIVVTLLAATAWVALDPGQVVRGGRGFTARPAGELDPLRVELVSRPVPLAAPAQSEARIPPPPAAPAGVIALPERSPVRRLALPSQTWQVVTDGRYAAYPRVDADGANVIVVGVLDGSSSNPPGFAPLDPAGAANSNRLGLAPLDRAGAPNSNPLGLAPLDPAGAPNSNPLGLAPLDRAGPPNWRDAYRTGERRVLGQLSLADGVLAFEELSSGTSEPSVTVHALRLHDVPSNPLGLAGPRGWTLVDEYLVPGAGRDAVAVASAAPRTDGRRVFWVRQTATSSGLRVSEIRALDLESGMTRALYRTAAAVPVLAVWKDTLAFTVLSEGAPALAMTLDLASGEALPVEGFSYAYVQDLGPRGLALLASDSPSAPIAAWLVSLADRGRVRIGVDCSVAMSERVLATRCGPRLAVEDLATGRMLYQQSAQLGLPAVFDRGAVWSDGDALVVYELPALPSDELDAKPVELAGHDSLRP